MLKDLKTKVSQSPILKIFDSKNEIIIQYVAFSREPTVTERPMKVSRLLVLNKIRTLVYNFTQQPLTGTDYKQHNAQYFIYYLSVY